MKIKIGMHAPTKEQYKATGTDGNPSPELKTQNLNEIKEGKLIPFSPNRVGSSTVGSGARRAKVEEPLAWAEEYPIQWREPRVDLAELAKLRWIEGLSRKELAERYGKTTVAIQNFFQQLRRINFRIPGLSDNERAKILLESKN